MLAHDVRRRAEGDKVVMLDTKVAFYAQINRPKTRVFKRLLKTKHTSYPKLHWRTLQRSRDLFLRGTQFTVVYPLGTGKFAN